LKLLDANVKIVLCKKVIEKEFDKTLDIKENIKLKERQKKIESHLTNESIKPSLCMTDEINDVFISKN
jgi:predicted phage-related endonuclease